MTFSSESVSISTAAEVTAPKFRAAQVHFVEISAVLARVYIRLELLVPSYHVGNQLVQIS